MRWLKKILRWLLMATVGVLVFLLLVELAFRYQWVDFYTAEFDALNSAEELKETTGPTVLVGGDSFTGTQHSYVKTMREQRPNARIVNAGIPGTGITEAACFLPDRIEEWQPDIFIYQMYVGNDLLDIRHPVGAESIGWARAAYWWLSDRLRSLRYINYKLAQFRYGFTNEVGNADSTLDEPFSVEAYSARERLNFAAEPQLVYNSAFLKGGRRSEFEVLLAELTAVLEVLPEGCETYLLVLPHCAQVSTEYLDRMSLLGAEFPNGEEMLEWQFPLVMELDEAFAEDEFVQLLSAQPFLQDREQAGVAMYYSDDPHLNPVGQELLGGVLAAAVPK